MGQRHRAAHRTEPHTHSWHCTTTHAASALSPHSPIPNFCSAASQWVSDLLISLFQTAPVSPSAAGCPSLHGWRGTSAGQLTDCIPPHKTFIVFSTTLTKQNFCSLFPYLLLTYQLCPCPPMQGPANVPLPSPEPSWISITAHQRQLLLMLDCTVSFGIDKKLKGGAK